MLFEIKNRWTGELIEKIDAETLQNMDLRNKNWNNADLNGARLDGARLDGANLTPIRNDMWNVLLTAIPEVPGLKKAIIEGRIKGSAYSGQCACLFGTIGNLRGVEGDELPGADSSRPIECFFMAILEGDTPQTSQFSKLALEWLEEFESFIAAPLVAQYQLNKLINKGENTMTENENAFVEPEKTEDAETVGEPVKSAEDKDGSEANTQESESTAATAMEPGESETSTEDLGDLEKTEE